MKIHEYQAKEILRGYGIPVPKAAETPEEARKVAEEIGGKP
jgi:succinyl-CoA synthetase beta subunit